MWTNDDKHVLRTGNGAGGTSALVVELWETSIIDSGRRRPLASLTLEQQLQVVRIAICACCLLSVHGLVACSLNVEIYQERQKQFATIMAAAAFCAAAAKAMAGFGPISQARC